MNWDTVKGQWKQFRGQVKEQWGKLTDDDLDRIEGKRDQLLGTVQKRYGIARDEAERQLREFEARKRPTLNNPTDIWPGYVIGNRANSRGGPTGR